MLADLVLALRLFLTTRQTVQRHADVFRSPFCRSHPMPRIPWRVVTNMLAVPTFQVSYPVALFVHFKAGDLARHA
jgi:hypothetical protein